MDCCFAELHLLSKFTTIRHKVLCHSRTHSFAQNLLNISGLIEAPSPPMTAVIAMCFTYVWTCLCARSKQSFLPLSMHHPGLWQTSGIFT